MAVLSTSVLHSHYATVDVLVTFWSTAALLAITRAVLGSDQRWLYLASLFTGLAIGVKYNAALLLLPLVIVWIAIPPESNLSSLNRPRKTAWILLACGTAIIMVSTWLLARSSALLSLFASLTTDGIVESEYVSLLRAGSLLPGLLGLLMLATAGLLLNWPGGSFWPRLFKWSNFLPILIVLAVFSLSSPFFLDRLAEVHSRCPLRNPSHADRIRRTVCRRNTSFPGSCRTCKGCFSRYQFDSTPGHC